MNFIDLCAGIGGIRLGLEQAGHKCVGFCEFDKFAIQSYKAIQRENGKHMTLQKLQTMKYENWQQEEQLTLFAEDFPAKPLALPEKEKVLLTREVLSSLTFADLLELSSHGILSVKMSKDFCRMKEGKLSELSSKPWQNWGIAWNGKYLTARTSECHKIGNACSLSDILEQEVQEKYFLSKEQTEKILANYKK